MKKKRSEICDLIDAKVKLNDTAREIFKLGH